MNRPWRWRWRVWLQGEREPRAVETERRAVIYAVATAMDQRGPRSPHQSLRAQRVELLDHDGSVLQAWRGP